LIIWLISFYFFELNQVFAIYLSGPSWTFLPKYRLIDV
jgi:hypothetical protein